MILPPERAAAALLVAAALSCAPGDPGAPGAASLASPAGTSALAIASASPAATPAAARDAARPATPPRASGAPPAGPSIPGWKALDPPAIPSSLAPQLTSGGENGILLTWIERTGESARLLRLARLGAGGWSAPVTVAAGSNFFSNWADVPAVAEVPGSGLLATWLSRAGPGTYDYSIATARSEDGGATWSPPGLLHEPGPGEHGFMSFAPDEGGLRAFFLQGTAEKGTTLRTVLVPAARGFAAGRRPGTPGVPGALTPPAAIEVVDPRVCDCCPTAAALAAGGPVVAYRDRSPEEVRDIYLIRRTAAGWSRPVRVGRDDWRIPGCPVNGPAVVAAGREVAVAWFTAAPPGPRVQVAFSHDGGATFGPAVPVDAALPLGRVSLVPAGPGGGGRMDGKGRPGRAAERPAGPGRPAGTGEPGEVIVGWLAGSRDGQAAITLRRVAPSGAGGPPLAVAGTGSTRASGIPRLARDGDRLVVVWVEDGGPRRLRGGSLPLAAVPPVRPAPPRR